MGVTEGGDQIGDNDLAIVGLRTRESKKVEKGGKRVAGLG